MVDKGGNCMGGNYGYSGVLVVSGPYGEQEDQQVFVQKVVPETDQLFIRLSSCGKR